MRVQREQRARWAAEAAARATEEAEAAAPTALPAPETSLQSMSAVADANGQGEEENALVMTSREIKEMRRAEKARRKAKGKEEQKGGGEEKEKKGQEKEKGIARDVFAVLLPDLLDHRGCERLRVGAFDCPSVERPCEQLPALHLHSHLR